jgi:hypothetical protein
MIITSQQEYNATNDPNGLNPFIHNPTRIFYGSIENLGYTLLNYFQASP